MSHFAVSVFTKDGQKLEELLAPYQENNMGTCPKEYLEFKDVEEENKTDYENNSVDKIKLLDGTLVNTWNYKGDKSKLAVGESFITITFKELYPSFEEYLKDWCGYSDRDEETGKYGYWENPNAKWDWYQIGGRYSGLLELKSGASSGEYGKRSWTNKDRIISDNKVDSAKVKDIDHSINQKEYNENLRFWELKVEGASPINEKEQDIVKRSFYNPEYYSKKYDNKEQFAQLSTEFGTYAVITPDGKWHSKGDMGWFACSTETDEEAKQWNKSFKELFVETADPEWTLTVVDCHI